jgi:hypothetical protein
LQEAGYNYIYKKIPPTRGGRCVYQCDDGQQGCLCGRKAAHNTRLELTRLSRSFARLVEPTFGFLGLGRQAAQPQAVGLLFY